MSVWNMGVKRFTPKVVAQRVGKAFSPSQYWGMESYPTVYIGAVLPQTVH